MLALALLGLSGAALAQQTPSPVLETNAPLNAGENPPVRNRFAAADEALAAGLTELAAGLYAGLAEELRREPAAYERARIGLASCLLERNDPDGAAKVLEPLPESPSRQIRLAIARILRGAHASVGDSLSTLNPALLPAADLPWYHIARGLFALATGNFQGAQTEFSQAGSYYIGESQYYQEQHVRMLDYLARIRVGDPPSDELITGLRQSMLVHDNDPLGFKFAKELAIALTKRDRSAEAVDTLRRRSFVSSGERDESDLLVGFILGADKTEGRQALYNVITNKAAPELQQFALHALAGAVERVPFDSPANPAVANEIYLKLTEVAASPDPRTLDLLNLVRARVMFTVRAFSQAERAANDLLEKTPSSVLRADELRPLRADALRILASVAWQSGAHRRAADYLTQLQSLLTGPAQVRTGLIAADCLFLSAHTNPAAYPLAGAAYAALQPRLPMPQQRGNALFLRMQCELLAGNGNNARQLLATAAAPPGVDTASMLRCEWAFVEWLRDNQHPAEAAQRLAALFKTHPDMDTGFRIRFLWQQALLALGANDTAGATRLAGQIADTVEKLPPSAPPELLGQARTILSKVSLLKARAVLAADQYAAAAADFAALRKKFPNEEATAASYLVEGRGLAARGDHARARDIFLSAHRLYPKQSPLAGYGAEALYEAAQQYIALAKNGGGEDRPFRPAVEALENFATDYPDHPLAHSAKLQQADLFRITTDFDDALSVYDRLITQLANDPKLADTPDRWRAELGRADCLFAKAMSGSAALARPAGGDTAAIIAAINANLGRAIDAYARLFTLPDKSPDMKAEAGCKWSTALAARQPDPQGGGRTGADIAREAEEARWQVITQVLKDQAVAARLGSSGRYWAVRSLMDLAASYKARGLAEDAAQVYRLLLDYNRNVQNTPERVLPFQNIAKRELANRGAKNMTDNHGR